MPNANAAGLAVAGACNPNWRGGQLHKSCATCGKGFSVRPGRPDARFCSLQCVGVAQRGIAKRHSRKVTKQCSVCEASFTASPSHADRYECCSRKCGGVLRSRRQSGNGNPNWNGGISRLPYPWDFRLTSKQVIERDDRKCQNPTCRGADKRMTAHHIDYDKANCSAGNLIALCSSCNSRANFDRPRWRRLYSKLMAKREEF
jgi:5-methylcytosine-specific restriction endonuclease McrA